MVDAAPAPPPGTAFRLLGRVEAVVDGRPARLAPLTRTLLAALLLSAGTAVPRSTLFAALWGEHPPASPVNGLQVQIGRLRKALRPDLNRRDGEPRLVTQADSYLLDLGHAGLDLARFRTLVAGARERAGQDDVAGAAAALRRALEVWQGEPLADVASPYLVSVHRAALREARLSAREDLNDALLRLGEHADLVAELAEQVSRCPLRERLVEQWVLALHATGRTADALRVITEHRRSLAADYALDPGAALTRLELDLLRGTAVAPPPRGPAPGGVPVAPDPPAALIGRDADVAALVSVLRPAGSPRVVVYGPPGAGKTAVVLAAVASVRSAYPDGVVYLPLDSARWPPTATQVVHRLLTAVGVAPSRIPLDPADRAALLRAAVAGRTLLLVLDGAAAEAQVRPALSAPWAASVVVGRRPLAALDHVALHPVGPLDPAAATRLLRSAAGPHRVRPDEEVAAGAVTRWCGFLPLAVRIAGTRLAMDPRLTVADLARRLDSGPGLTLLRAGDLDVRASLASAYAALTPPARRALRLLCWVAGGEFTAAGAAAALGRSGPHTADLLDELVLAQVLTVGAGPRYGFLSVVRAFGRQAPPDRVSGLRAWRVRRARPGAAGAGRRAQGRTDRAGI